MAYLYTGSSSAAATNTGLSTQILVVIDGHPVGAIQSLRTSQRRSLKRIMEVGTDGTIELVPNSGTEVSLDVTRIYFDNKSLPAGFSRAFDNIHAQRIPFDVLVVNYSNVPQSLVNVQNGFDPGLGTANPVLGTITTVYENCWFESLTSSYQATDYVITQDCTLQAEFVHSFADGAPDTNSSSGVPLIQDPLERLADAGRRGSLDARGLGTLGSTFASLLNT